MDKKTIGAWLIHHARKIQLTTNHDFEQINFAGKAGVLLSAISAATQCQLDRAKLASLARANNISARTELPTILAELERQRLVATSATHVEVLGLTSNSVLEHVNTIFQESTPQPSELAVLDVSETVSELPQREQQIRQYIEDTFKVASDESSELLTTAKTIGFFDSEDVGSAGTLLFNGHLFRRDDAKKISAVLDSLSPAESKLVTEFGELLGGAGCVMLNKAQMMLGKQLFSKLHAIGLYDVSAVGNEYGQHHFVTRPSAFSKFSDSLADDALDLAKALVTSLTYGMHHSSYNRGKIQAIRLLVTKLINGGSVGPATAIGKDYQALETKGVVTVTPAHGGMFYMKLSKPEVGRLALAVIEEGGDTTQVLQQIPGANVTTYTAPEELRQRTRMRNVTEPVRVGIKHLINDIRTGALKR